MCDTGQHSQLLQTKLEEMKTKRQCKEMVWSKKKWCETKRNDVKQKEMTRNKKKWREAIAHDVSPVAMFLSRIYYMTITDMIISCKALQWVQQNIVPKHHIVAIFNIFLHNVDWLNTMVGQSCWSSNPQSLDCIISPKTDLSGTFLKNKIKISFLTWSSERSWACDGCSVETFL